MFIILMITGSTTRLEIIKTILKKANASEIDDSPTPATSRFRECHFPELIPATKRKRKA